VRDLLIGIEEYIRTSKLIGVLKLKRVSGKNLTAIPIYIA
jgi:hypothetical protein